MASKVNDLAAGDNEWIVAGLIDRWMIEILLALILLVLVFRAASLRRMIVGLLCLAVGALCVGVIGVAVYFLVVEIYSLVGPGWFIGGLVVAWFVVPLIVVAASRRYQADNSGLAARAVKCATERRQKY